MDLRRVPLRGSGRGRRDVTSLACYRLVLAGGAGADATAGLAVPGVPGVRRGDPAPAAGHGVRRVRYRGFPQDGMRAV